MISHGTSPWARRSSSSYSARFPRPQVAFRVTWIHESASSAPSRRLPLPAWDMRACVHTRFEPIASTCSSSASFSPPKVRSACGGSPHAEMERSGPSVESMARVVPASRRRRPSACDASPRSARLSARARDAFDRSRRPIARGRHAGPWSHREDVDNDAQGAEHLAHVRRHRQQRAGSDARIQRGC